jgi:hypothetical protein
MNKKMIIGSLFFVLLIVSCQKEVEKPKVTIRQKIQWHQS